ncbi:MAG: isoleucine--tRNA ligase, partial [Muribaculaceae bacterium]|nr:isoleucine--tRNA ligase [Muribaculaceae bacterium]
PVTVEVSDVELRNEDIPGGLVANEGTVTVALDVTVTDELRHEGIARELVNRIQNIRKNRDFDITQRINVIIGANSLTDAAVSEFADYIGKQVLADSLLVGQVDNPGEDEVLDIDGTQVAVKVTPA